jgi:site-specific DNA-cytosine methylase
MASSSSSSRPSALCEVESLRTIECLKEPPPPLQVCNRALDSIVWAKHCFERLGNSYMQPSEVSYCIANRKIKTGTLFAGIRSDGVAEAMIGAAAKSYLADNCCTTNSEDPRPIIFQSEWAVEISAQARDEILNAPDHPKHVFGDIREFVAPCLRKAVGLDGGKELRPDRLRKMIRQHRGEFTLTAPCYNPRCKGKRRCQLSYVDLLVCTSPCVDHSEAGCQLGFNGPSGKLWWIFLAILRLLKPKTVINENVCGLNAALATEEIADLYIVIVCEADVKAMGWSITRNRQGIILILKTWLYPVILNENRSSKIELSPDTIKEKFDIGSTMALVSHRQCAYTYNHNGYMIGNDDEVKREFAWAGSRPAVLKRHQQPDQYHDQPGSALWLLTTKERGRVADASNTHAGEVLDVDKNFRSVSCEGVLATMVARTGLLMVVPGYGIPAGRWLTVTEMATAMGHPVISEAQRACGAQSTYSRGVSAPSSRSLAAQRRQIGNAVHINFVGALILSIVFKLPALGRLELASTNATSSNPSHRVTTSLDETRELIRSMTDPPCKRRRTT